MESNNLLRNLKNRGISMLLEPRIRTDRPQDGILWDATSGCLGLTRNNIYSNTDFASSDVNSFRTPATPNGLFNRTLKAQSLINTGMTPAMCIEFCSNFSFSYGFAGVELGQVSIAYHRI